MYIKDFRVRWSEIDSNLHMTSSAYIKYITDTRMTFFEDYNFGLPEMKKNMIGPVVLSEKSYYFKEIHPGEDIKVSLEVGGQTEDQKRVLLVQRIFDDKGQNCFLAHTLVAFIDIVARKMITPPPSLATVFEKAPKTSDFRILEKAETRDEFAVPINL